MKIINDLKINNTRWDLNSLLLCDAPCLKFVGDDMRHFVNGKFPYPYSPIWWKIRKDTKI